MNTLNKKVKNRLALTNATNFKIKPFHHVVFWAFYFLFNFLRWGSFYSDYLYSFKSNLLGFPIHIILSYFTIYYLIPRYIFRKKFLSFVVLLILSIFIMVFFKFELTKFLISNNVWPEGPETYYLTFDYTIVMMLGELYVITFVASIKLTIDWLRESGRIAKLEKAQLETELKFLRNQISPHFFFNTLNNIYAQSLDNSKDTPDTILKLSDLMRYLIYDANKKKYQSLKKELEFLENYIELERIRHTQNLNLVYHVEGNPRDKKIIPLLLINFVENAFKHGANKSIEKVDILIDLIIKEDWLTFKINNTKPTQKFITVSKKDKGGVGLTNVKKRLELRYAENEYDLNITETKTNFQVELNLKLMPDEA
ncbi:sensor histidine kinase [Croceivirga radicis]|uniref:Sensor histidine kinase n=1 Tax=Croceivirga radicis TaxID=1929488 RepID=A0A1V6LT16_9FLAO|nr:sensor histidine kinase [Croceivirga radicis]